MKTEELMRRVGTLCAEHGYVGASKLLGASESSVRRVVVYGGTSPTLRRAAARYFGEARSWSSQRERLFADMGEPGRTSRLLAIIEGLGLSTTSDLLRAIADGDVVVARRDREDEA